MAKRIHRKVKGSAWGVPRRPPMKPVLHKQTNVTAGSNWVKPFIFAA